MNEQLVLVHTEMCCVLHILAWTAVLVFLILASFTVGGAAVSIPNTFAHLEHQNSSTLSGNHTNRIARLQIINNHASDLTSTDDSQTAGLFMKNKVATKKSALEIASSLQRTSAKDGITRTNKSTTNGKDSIDRFNDNQAPTTTRVKNNTVDDISGASIVDTENRQLKTPHDKMDTSKLSELTNLDKGRMFGNGYSVKNHRLGLKEISKRSRSKGNNDPASLSLRRQASTGYEPSVHESVVLLGVAGTSEYKQKEYLNGSTNAQDAISRPQRQIHRITPPMTNNRNIRARVEGDAIIGAIFPLHRAPPHNSAYARQCGEIWENYGIQRVETFLMTVDSINRNPLILPNITLGWDIRDSCWYSAIALENSIDFIKDAIASQSKTSNTNSSVTNSSLPSSSSSSTLTSSLKDNDDTVQSCTGNKNLKPIIGLVGPGSSESTIQVQNLLQIFNIPQIGYSATSHDLSNKNHYRYFLRVVPPDLYQAQVLVDILITCNWTYVSTVYTDGNYGLKGITQFTDLAKSKGICIAESDNVPVAADDATFDKVLENLLAKQNASVVVCFCDGMTVRNLFNATRRKRMDRRLLIIGSDGWGNRQDVVQNLEQEAAGAISIMLHSPPFKDFGPHYARLKPHGSPLNPWFNEFWEYRFKCSLDKDNPKDYNRYCQGNESLAGSEEDSKLGFVVNAVTTLALGLHNMHQDLCPGSKTLCPAMEPLNGSVYLEYLLNVSFKSYSDEQVYFDEAGDPPGRYEILNYRAIPNENGSISYDYVTIGHWSSGNLSLDLSKVYWPQSSQDSGSETDGIITSVCSEPCKWNEATQSVKGVACCWICRTCAENEILVTNNTDCKACDLGKWPNFNKTDCEDIPIDFIYWRHTQAVVCMTLGSLGICATLWVFAIFIRYHNTPVVKASTRELSYILLVGICLAFGSNFFIVSKPAKAVCYMTRILPGLSFSLMYGALVTRTNRIARILEGSKRIMTKKPKFMSATAQVVITGIIIGIECAVITAILVYQPADARLDYSTPKKVRLICDTSTLGIVVPLGFDLVLILLCTIYAVKTRNLPENFNEAKFIGFTMYSTCVIWLGFFPIYFAGENKEVTLSISVSLSAAIALALLFMPKVYVIVWVPSKNTRGAFTTSKDVRCHIGSKSMNSGDSIDIKESSTYESLFKPEKGQGRHWRQKSLDEKRFRFIMQRTPCSEEETPYVNHGVLDNHSNVKSPSFVDMVSKESCKTDSRAGGAHSCPDKERLFLKESKEIYGAEIIRKNLARDFPMHLPQVTLRPGSPAEKLKHRIHNTNPAADLEELQETQTLNVNGRLIKPWEIRKSLSSTCVSLFPKTVSVQCQTTDDLVDIILPPLRRRYVSKNKKKLERSEAVEDFVGSASGLRKEEHTFINPTSNHSKSLAIRRSHGPQFHDDDDDDDSRHSPFELSETSPLMMCHNSDHQEFLFMPDTSAEMFNCHFSDHIQRRHSYNIPRSEYNLHQCDIGDHYSKDPTRPSPNLPLSAVFSQRASSPDLFIPFEFSDNKSNEGVEKAETHISPICNIQCNPFFRHLPRNFPEPGMSPSNQNSDKSHSYPNNVSLIRQDSHSSTSISIASSSSFTLPPFRSSTDSNPSQQTFDDSYNSLEIEPRIEITKNNGYSNHENRGLTEIHQCKPSQLQVDNILNSKETPSEVAVVPLESVNKQEDDMLEFHRLLQGHGVKIELSTVQTSDL